MRVRTSPVWQRIVICLQTLSNAIKAMLFLFSGKNKSDHGSQSDPRGNRDRYHNSSTPRRGKPYHEVSESEEYASDGDDVSSGGGRFQNPEDFLRAFGGYESDEEDPADEDEDLYARQRGDHRKFMNTFESLFEHVY